MKRDPISFDDTEIAFSSLSDRELKNSYRLFKLMSIQWLVNLGGKMAPLALSLPFIPGKSILKKTIYKQFCGGESIKASLPVIQKLQQYNVETILDYGVEAKIDEIELEKTAQHLVKGIEFAKKNPDVNIISCKVTGLIRFGLLEKVNQKEELSKAETVEWQNGKRRLKFVCKAAFECDIQLYIDAEESWIQDAIDELVEEMMAQYNQEKGIVFNTIQLYRHDKLAYLKESYGRATKGNYFLAVKVVRGAYLEKENLRAEEMSYPSPMQKSKADTDRDFDLGIAFCLDNLENIYLCAATHNQESCRLLVERMDALGLERNDPRVFVGQLFGMSDNLSFNLAAGGFKVAKYMPYGPVREVIPYLVRRANENTSVAGQMGRELKFLRTEMRRRNLA